MRKWPGLVRRSLCCLFVIYLTVFFFFFFFTTKKWMFPGGLWSTSGEGGVVSLKNSYSRHGWCNSSFMKNLMMYFFFFFFRKFVKKILLIKTLHMYLIPTVKLNKKIYLYRFVYCCIFNYFKKILFSLLPVSVSDS